MSITNKEGLNHQVRFLDNVDRWTTCVLEDISNTRIKEIFQDCVVSPVDVGKAQQPSEREADKLAKKIRSAIISSTPQYVRAELTSALDDNKFDEKFQLLHDLGEKYKDRSKKAWRPPYDAKEHMRTARVRIKEAQLKRLQLIISIKKQTIEGLKEKVRNCSGASNKIPELVHQIEEDSNSTRFKAAILMESLATSNHQISQLCSFEES